AGVDYDDVVVTLEQEGVKKFSDSFTELLDGVSAKRGELVSACGSARGDLHGGCRRRTGARARARGNLRQPYVGRPVGVVRTPVPRSPWRPGRVRPHASRGRPVFERAGSD